MQTHLFTLLAFALSIHNCLSIVTILTWEDEQRLVEDTRSSFDVDRSTMRADGAEILALNKVPNGKLSYMLFGNNNKGDSSRKVYIPRADEVAPGKKIYWTETDLAIPHIRGIAFWTCELKPQVKTVPDLYVITGFDENSVPKTLSELDKIHRLTLRGPQKKEYKWMMYVNGGYYIQKSKESFGAIKMPYPSSEPSDLEATLTKNLVAKIFEDATTVPLEQWYLDNPDLLKVVAKPGAGQQDIPIAQRARGTIDRIAANRIRSALVHEWNLARNAFESILVNGNLRAPAPITPFNPPPAPIVYEEHKSSDRQDVEESKENTQEPNRDVQDSSVLTESQDQTLQQQQDPSSIKDQTALDQIQINSQVVQVAEKAEDQLLENIQSTDSDTVVDTLPQNLYPSTPERLKNDDEAWIVNDVMNQYAKASPPKGDTGPGAGVQELKIPTNRMHGTSRYDVVYVADNKLPPGLGNFYNALDGDNDPDLPQGQQGDTKWTGQQ